MALRMKKLLLLLVAILLSQSAFVPAMAQTSLRLKQAHVVVRIDLFTRKLTVFRNGQIEITVSIAAGKPTTPTPIGIWRVITKYKDWGGGFGTRWLGLNVPWGIYGIHGTNKPHLVGQSVSAGCIRTKNENIERIYPHIPLGTCVVIDGNPLGGPFHLPRELSKGSRGSDVQLVQGRLYYAKFYHGPLDGVFGDDMEYALLRYERKVRVPVDGVVDSTDYIAMGLEE